LKRNQSTIEKVIDRLAEEWLGKNGVVAISDEEVEGELCIVFLVDLPDPREEDYPQEINGYKVIIRKSGQIVAY